jgi:hypothetical protein
MAPDFSRATKKENGAKDDRDRRQGIEQPRNNRCIEKRKSRAEINEPQQVGQDGRQKERHRRRQRIRFRHHNDEKRDRQRGEQEVDHT